MNHSSAVGQLVIRAMRASLVIALVLTSLAALNAQEQTGTIVFYREKHFINYQYTFSLFCDGAELTPMVNGSSLRVTAAVGKHHCVAQSLQRTPTEIEVTPGSVVYLRMYTDPAKKPSALLLSSTLKEFMKHRHKLIGLAPVRLPVAPSDSGQATPPNIVSPRNTHQTAVPADASRNAQPTPVASAPSSDKSKAIAPAPVATPEVVSEYKSAGDNTVLLTLYRKSGDKYAPFAIGELKGEIAFNSKGIAGNVDGLQRLQFSEPKNKWLAISQRSVAGGKAVVTTEDGKSYTIFNLGIRPFAGQIEPVELNPDSSNPNENKTTSDQTTTANLDAGKTDSRGASSTVESDTAPKSVSTAPLTPEQQAFSAATQAGTPAAWEAFLKRYPAAKSAPEARRALDALLYTEALLVQTDASALETIFRRCKTPEGADKVFALSDDASFQTAKELGTENAYRIYLRRFPKGAHLAAVQESLDGIAWQPCSNKDVESCRKYLKEYPEGIHGKDARRRVDESEYDQVKAEDTIEGYEKFLGQHYNNAAATARLQDLLYEKAVASGELADWVKFHDKSVYPPSPDGAMKGKLATSEKEIERLMYAEIVAGSTLGVCEDYLRRFNDGIHAQQVQVAMEPLLFEYAKKENSIAGYEKYLDKYPQGSFRAQAQSLLDPVLFAWASKEDWHSSYQEYLRVCATCSNAEKAEGRVAALKAIPAIPSADFPTELVSPSQRWEWDTVFKETGGKTRYKVQGSGYIITPKGEKYVSQYGGTISRGELMVPAGGSAKDNYWVRSGDGDFCDGYAVFDWSGEDAGGKPVHFEVKVHLKCSSNTRAK